MHSDPNVHPGQLGYFGKGYTNASGSTSFDYDCDGTESEQPGFAHLTGCSSCPSNGYPPATPVRSGVGIDPYCGANQLLSCFPTGSASGVSIAMASGSSSGCSGAVATTVAIGCR
jgi:hypothetical protein